VQTLPKGNHQKNGKPTQQHKPTTAQANQLTSHIEILFWNHSVKILIVINYNQQTNQSLDYPPAEITELITGRISFTRNSASRTN